MSVTIGMLVIIIMVEVKMMMIAGVAAEKGDADGDNDKLFTDAILHKLMADAAQTSWGGSVWYTMKSEGYFQAFWGGLNRPYRAFPVCWRWETPSSAGLGGRTCDFVLNISSFVLDWAISMQ